MCLQGVTGKCEAPKTWQTHGQMDAPSRFQWSSLFCGGGQDHILLPGVDGVRLVTWSAALITDTLIGWMVDPFAVPP